MENKDLITLDNYHLAEGEIGLFGFWRSSATWRLRIVFNLKKIDYKYIVVNLLEGKQKSEKFLEFNPTALVPVLKIDGHVLSESLPIMEYLEETRPDKTPLLPKDPYLKARVREICEHINSGMQPLANLRVLNKVEDDLKSDKVQWAKYWNELGLDSLEKILQKTAGKFCVGDEITWADVLLVPQAWAAFIRFGIDQAKYPIITRIYGSLQGLDEFKKAAPENQPDAVKA